MNLDLSTSYFLQKMLLQVTGMYFKPVVLPDAKGSLAHSIPSAAIAAANGELQEMIADYSTVPSGKRKLYQIYHGIYYKCKS